MGTTIRDMPPAKRYSGLARTPAAVSSAAGCLGQVVSGRVCIYSGADAEHGDGISDLRRDGVPTRQTPAMRTAMREGPSVARALAPHIAVDCHISAGPESSLATVRMAWRSFHGAGDSSHHVGRPIVATARLGSPHSSWRACSMMVSASVITSTTRSPSASVLAREFSGQRRAAVQSGSHWSRPPLIDAAKGTTDRKECR